MKKFPISKKFQKKQKKNTLYLILDFYFILFSANGCNHWKILFINKNRVFYFLLLYINERLGPFSQVQLNRKGERS